MGIFSRFRDIVSSNLNNMLDRAEDPEKMLKLMIYEMEETLVELKASCAKVIADRKQIQRRLAEMVDRETKWRDRAELAVSKGRDDLAREALIEKRRFSRLVASLEADESDRSGVVAQYQEDIRQLEEKLDQARQKQRMLIHRHIQAQHSRRAREEIRRADNYDTIARFEEFEHRIERMEAEAEMVRSARKPDLEAQFDALNADDEIESELDALKKRSRKETIQQ